MGFSTSLTFIVLILPISALSQNVEVIFASEFYNISLDNKVTILQLENETDYKSRLTQLFGQPVEEDCVTDMFGKSCEFIYSGFELSFAFDNQLFDLSLTSAQSFLRYGPYQLKPGMTLSELQVIFPDAYNDRRLLNLGNETRNIINVYVGHSGSDTVITFFYNPTTNKVVEVNINYELI